MRDIVHENGLLLACVGLFGVFFLGMIVSGAATYNEEQREHGSAEQISVLQYLATGDFVEATFENWESEFLQMGMYVVLTAFLYQKGSSESKPLNKPAPQDADPREASNRNAPWPVKRGGWPLTVYEHSLAIAFFALFFASWALHAMGGVSGVQRGADPARAGRRSRCGGTSPRRSSGSSRCRTGRANSSRSRRSSGCRSSCVSEGRPNRSRSPTRIGRPARDYPVRLGNL